MKDIHWYPGHMTKARRMMEESAKLIDVVIELVDARAPKSSRNPDFDALFAAKKRIVVLNKADLCELDDTAVWCADYKARGWDALAFVSTQRGNKGRAIAAIEAAAKEKVQAMAKKGVTKTVRAMVTGIPNVGKSTFLNCLSGGGAMTGNRPGVTRGKQWVRLSPTLELMDTPGLLWPKLEDKQGALHLAYIGAIRDGVMDTEALSISLLEMLNARWPEALRARYSRVTTDLRGEALLEAVCQSRGFLLPGALLDIDRAATTVLDEFRSAKILKATLEMPGGLRLRANKREANDAESS